MDADRERRKGKAGGGEQEQQVLPKRHEKNPVSLVDSHGDSYAAFRTWTFSRSLQDIETFSCFTEYRASHAPSFHNALCKQRKPLKKKFCKRTP